MTTNSIHIQGHRILFEMYEVILFTIGTLVINIIYFVLLDRLMMAAVQRRTGPYNVGYFGLLQSMDDGLRISYLILILGNIKDRTLIFTAMVNVFIVVGLFL